MPKRVLVTEDDDVSFQLAEVVLQRLGVTVLRAGTGSEAIEMVTANQPDLIYMDIHLPDLDGLEVVRRIRANADTHDIPIVALTALAMVGDSARALEAGCNAYLSKPISTRELAEITRRFLGKSEAHD